MKKKDIAVVIKKHLQKIEKHAEDVGNKNDIHKLRVHYKKLRACLRLMRPGEKPHIPARLKKVYEHAGVLRQLQLYHKSIYSFFRGNTIYLAYISQQMSQENELFRKKTAQLNIEKVNKQLKKHLPEKSSKKEWTQFVKKKAEKIEKLYKTEMPDTAMHSVRKLLKDILYTSEGFQYAIEKWLPIANKTTIIKLNKFTDDLGSYHDMVANISLLEKDIAAGKLPVADINTLKKIRETWMHRKSHSQKEILNNV